MGQQDDLNYRDWVALEGPLTPTGRIRRFSSGATRDDDSYKFDIEGFIHPEVLEVYSAYMHKHRRQPDGTMRASDNWQQGMPRKEYVKSLVRHTMELWRTCRGMEVRDKKTGELISQMDSLCGIFFNVQGLMLEIILGRVVTELEEGDGGQSR